MIFKYLNCNSLQIRNKLQQPKEKLTQLHKINRATFSDNYLKSFLSNFPLVFSDESIVALQPFRKKIKVMPIFQNDEYFFDKCGYPIKIMIWGCIGFNFKSKLILIKEKLNSKEYLKILIENNIIVSLNERYGPLAYIFQQDGASPHRAKKTINCLSQKVKLLEGDLSWPSNSPDLNVIEIIWAIIKAKLDTDKIKDSKSLFDEINKIWEEIPISTINNLVLSFQSRLHSCIMLHGESLNGNKKLMKKFQESYQTGNEYIEKKRQENTSKAYFIEESNHFFNQIKLFDTRGNQCINKNCTESIRICNILPEYFLEKINMPKPISKHGNLVFVPK